MPQPAPRHQFWIDRGGTFTDCIHRDTETGALRVTKVLSSDQAPLEGIRALLGLKANDAIPPSEVRMGTTLATNALLERGGCRCVLIANEGLGDLIRLGDQTRPELFALDIEKPEPLADAVIEVGARMTADGSLLHALDSDALRVALAGARSRGAESVAVALIHACRDDVASSIGWRRSQRKSASRTSRSPVRSQTSSGCSGARTPRSPTRTSRHC